MTPSNLPGSRHTVLKTPRWRWQQTREELPRPAASDGDGGVDAVSRLMWPPPLTVEMGRRDLRPTAGIVLSEYLVAPNRRAPALLLPLGSPRAAARAVLRPSAGTRGRQQAGRRAAALAFRAGLGPHVMRDRLYICTAPGSPADPSSIEMYLRGVFGPDVLIALAVGPIRANRKPVLQVLTPAGHLVAFVKVGWNALTRSLVSAEAKTLAGLVPTRLGPVQPPHVLHVGTWRDLSLLALAPLIGTARRGKPGELPMDAMRGLATHAGTEVRALKDSRFWTKLREQITALPDPRTRDALLAIHLTANGRWGKAPVTFGAWHGDWTKWNMAWDGRRVLLWDWERYETDVPVGLDAYHYALQSRLHGDGTVEPAAARVRRDAATLAAGMGMPPEQGQLLLGCYLLSLLLRYENDSQDAMGARLRPVAESLRAVVARQVSAG